MAPDSNSRLVYSSDDGRVAPPKDAKPAARSKAASTATPRVPDDGVVRVSRQKQGRGGKTVTLVTGLPGSEAELDALLKDLKQHCGAGGSRNGRALEVQGDNRERIRAYLETRGHKPRLAGG